MFTFLATYATVKDTTAKPWKSNTKAKTSLTY